VSGFTFKARRRDGSDRWAEMSAQIMENREDHFVLSGFISDIEERVKAEKVLRRNDLRFRRIFESLSGVAVQGYSPKGLVTYWNTGSERIYGYSREEALGKSLLDLIIPPEMRPEVEKAVAHMHASGETKPPAELRLMRKGGTPVDVFSHHSLVDVPGVGKELYCIDIDLSERKRAESELRKLKDSLVVTNTNLEAAVRHARELAVQAEAANVAKSRFVANMSHEIRTPLNGIIGMADLLREMNLGEEERASVETIQHCGFKLTALISDVLDLSSIEVAGGDLRQELFSFDELISGCEEVVAVAGMTKQLTLRHEIDPALPEELYGDRDRLQQILINLLSNAVKFTVDPGREVLTRVREISRMDRKAEVFLEVEDEGIGIAAERLEEIFEPFHQLDDSSTRAFEGTGLGLSIVKGLVEMMEGTVSVRSEPGKGSCFEIRLELGLPEPPVALQKQPTEPAIALGPNKPTSPEEAERSLPVLLVEDNVTNRMVAKLFLERCGRKVLVAANGKEAIALLREKDVGICLMDLQMPEMDGIAATRAIRGGEAGVRNTEIPIIALTARVMNEDRRKCLEAGVNDFIPKPVHLQDFETTLQRWTE